MIIVILEIVAILLMLVANGIFAMTEIAVVSSRKTRLKRLANAGDHLFGFKPAKEPVVTEEDVKVLMLEGLRSGAFNKVESEIIASVLDLDRLCV